ncbi:hypothetical protein BH18ACT5_BH18ACT5_02280 [soil metagenome]
MARTCDHILSPSAVPGDRREVQGQGREQQHGYVHAGVVTTLADHTAGGAASTEVRPGQSVLTADFTVHLLRPASGELLRCRGDVVKVGKRLIVTQADVWDGETHCARYLGTMAVVDQAL